jgi:hypothetical protein
MKIEPQKEHQWLQKLVGEWTYEGEAMMGPDKPSMKSQGTETVRSLGGLWIVAEGQGEMPDCGPATTLMSLGYDPQQKKYVGTWIASMMNRLWIYSGELDASQKVLTLETEGPDMVNEGKTAQYRDVIEFHSDDHRTLSSYALGEDGKWVRFMTAHYHRKS